MKSITKLFLAFLMLTVGVLTSSSAMAGSVANTVHNFSYGGWSNVFTSNSVTQVCVFCHTPHNAGQTRLLWNKDNNSVTNFRLYTSSPTLRSVTKKASLTGNSPSLLCLSCHDGKTAINVLHSAPSGNSTDAQPGGYPAGSRYITQNSGVPGAVLMPQPSDWTDPFSGELAPPVSLGWTASNPLAGDNLTDDHPIGFSYSAVLAERSPGLFSIAEVGTKSSNKIRFFGSESRMECSSCHDPHVDADAMGDQGLRPFLVMNNSGSKLCLSCHDK